MAILDGARPGTNYNVMFIGDSITVGANGGTQSTQAGGYRSSVCAGIRKIRPTLRTVGWQQAGNLYDNNMCGVSGQRVDQLLADPYVTSQINGWRVDLAILHCGTNDCTQLNSGTWVGGSIALSITNLGLLLDKIRQANAQCHVLLAKIIPNQTAGADTQIDLWNAAMLTAVAARSDSGHIHVANHNGAFKADASWATDYMSDVTHPNQAGNVIMYNTWMTAFNALVS